MEFMIYNREQAEKILKAFNECDTCSECALNTPEGWKCSYLAEQAKKYLEKNR